MLPKHTRVLMLALLITQSSALLASPDYSRTDTVPATTTAPIAQTFAETVNTPATVEIDADFPGGEKKWHEFLAKKLVSSVPVTKGAPAGNYQVVVQFIVDKTGRVTDIRPLTAFGYGMEEEVVRVIKSSPRWKPAVQGNGKVNAYRKQPITFSVAEKKKRRFF